MNVVKAHTAAGHFPAGFTMTHVAPHLDQAHWSLGQLRISSEWKWLFWSNFNESRAIPQKVNFSQRPSQPNSKCQSLSPLAFNSEGSKAAAPWPSQTFHGQADWKYSYKSTLQNVLCPHYYCRVSKNLNSLLNVLGLVMIYSSPLSKQLIWVCSVHFGHLTLHFLVWIKVM